MNRLKELRLKRGLLQSDIAKIINKSERTVGFYETGERDMGTETLGILADFFNVSVDYLLGRSDESNTMIDEINKKIIDNNLHIAANSKVDLGKLAQVDNKTAKLINTLIDDFLSED